MDPRPGGRGNNRTDGRARKRSRSAARAGTPASQFDEVLFSSVLDASGAAFAVIDPRGNFFRVNAALESMLGAAPGTLEGTATFGLLTTEAAVETMRTAIHSLMASSEPAAQISNTVTTVDGRVIDVLTSVNLLRDISGAPAWFVSVWTDVTSLHETIRRAEAAEAQVRAIVDALPDTVMVLDEGLRLSAIHLPTNTQPSRTAESLIGSAGADIFGPQFDQQVVEAREVSVANGSVSSFDAALRRSSGDVEIHEVRVLSVGSETLVLARDVTEARQLELRAARSESNLRAVMTAIPDSLVVVDRDGIIESCHVPGNLPSTSRGADSLIGRSLAEALGSESEASFLAAMDRARSTGQSVSYESNLRRSDGVVRYYDNRLALLDGERALVVCRDVSARHRAETELAEREQMLRTLTDTAPVGICCVDLSGHVFNANRRWAELVGRASDELLGHRYINHIHPADVGQFVERSTDALVRGEPFEGRIRVVHADGSCRWLQIRNEPNRDVDGTLVGAVSTAVDVTVAVDLEIENSRLADVLAASSDVAVITDRAGEVIYANPTARSFLGEHTRFTEVLSPVSERHYMFEVLPAVERYGTWSGELEYQVGELILPVSQLVVGERDDGGDLVSVAHVGRDIAELKEAQARLDHMAKHDVLTGLPNRVLFADRVEMALRRRERGSGRLALVFIDLDGFKQVNDDLGHEAGDVVLKAAAARIESAVRATDTAARIGGDEFVVLLEDLTSASEIHLIAERLVESLAQPVTVAGVDTRIGCSVGITFDGPDATVDQLLAEADQAMYLAKNAGKGCYRFYADPDLSDLGTSR